MPHFRDQGAKVSKLTTYRTEDEALALYFLISLTFSKSVEPIEKLRLKYDPKSAYLSDLGRTESTW